MFPRAIRLLTSALAMLSSSLAAAPRQHGADTEHRKPTLVVQGTVSVTYHTIWREERHRAFTCEHNADGWRIILSGMPGVNDYTVAFNSQGILGCATVFDNVLRDMIRRGVPVGSNVATAQVRRGSVPLFSTEKEIGFVWLTFASGTFLSTNTSGFMIPPYELGFRDGHATFEDLEEQGYTADMSPTSRLLFPMRATYFFGDTTTSLKRTDDASTYLPQWTNALYEVQQTTNVAGTVAPHQASLKVFAVHGAKIPFEIGRYSLQLTNAFLQEEAVNLVPDLPAATFFTEGRMADPVKRLFFNYQTNRWLTTDEVRRLPQYSSALARLGLAERRLTTQGVVMGAVCLGILLLPMLRSRRKQHN